MLLEGGRNRLATLEIESAGNDIHFSGRRHLKSFPAKRRVRDDVPPNVVGQLNLYRARR